MRPVALAFIALAALHRGVAVAAPADLARLFPFEGDIVVTETASGGERLLRLPLPPQVIEAARADLSDVRVFDAAGEEVPFVVDGGLRRGEVRHAIEAADAVVVDARRDRIAFDGEPTIYREEYVLRAPPAALAGSRWELVFDTDRPDYIRAVEVSALNGDQESTLTRDATIFRLRNAAAERDSVVLPGFQGERVRVALEGADGAYLAPRLRWRATTDFDRDEGVVVPLEVLRQAKEDGYTVVELRRPNGIVPDVLRLATSTPTYYRAVAVLDRRQGGGEERVGRGAVFRVELRKPVEYAEIRLAAARGDSLRMVIDDEDSPPLRDLRVFAEVRQPVLYFHLPAKAGSRTGVLRYGGARVDRPTYDLAQLSPADEKWGTPALLAAMLLERDQTVPAELRDLRPNPGFDPAPLLAFAMHPGAVVEAGGFSHRRALHVTDSPDGLSRLRLRPEDVALARADLGDLRIVDASGRQWPYLVQIYAGTAPVALGVSAALQEHGTTHYDLRLPVEPLPVESIRLDVGREFIRRPFRLIGRGEDGRERTLAQGQLSSGPQDPPLQIGLGGVRVVRLRLVVEDGDEAPIAIKSARAVVPEAELYLVAPKGDYTMLLGDAAAAPPRYDLAEVRDAVLSVGSAPASTGDLEVNPLRDWRHRVFGASPHLVMQHAAVWAVLGAAVLVLAWVTLRLVRREG